VTPSEETPRHGLWLSPLDLMMVNRGHTPNVYFYRYASSSGVADDIFFDVARLKAAMAKALVNFYPLAGRLGVDGDGRAEIDCAGQGAHFVVARSDLTVDDFSDCQPSLELKRLFVPHIVDDSPGVMLAVQLTFFKCGGVALGTALHHVAVDAVSAVHFFETWSAFSRAGSRENNVAQVLELPCHDRTLLRARSPPRVVHPDAAAMFWPLKDNPNISPPGPVVNEICVISKDQIAALKHASSGASTFCAVSAHVWRCMCVARRLAPEAATRLTFPANFRRSLRPPLPERYFGNGIIVVGAAGKVRDIASKDDLALASVAGRVKEAVRGLDDELVRSTIDYLEMNEAPPASSMPETEVRIVSWLGMPVYDVDFGWGKPLTMMRAVQQRAGLIYLIDNGLGDGGVRILLSIEAEALKDFQRLLYENL
jgi:shikimate O-hydroxycinnamoyltransferase